MITAISVALSALEAAGEAVGDIADGEQGEAFLAGPIWPVMADLQMKVAAASAKAMRARGVDGAKARLINGAFCIRVGADISHDGGDEWASRAVSAWARDAGKQAQRLLAFVTEQSARSNHPV
jgi:hypothetical protein